MPNLTEDDFGESFPDVEFSGGIGSGDMLVMR